MPNFFSDNADLQFYFDEGLDWEALVAATERNPHDETAPQNTEEAVSIYRDIAEMFGQFVADEVEPHSLKMDAAGVHMKDGEALCSPEFDQIFEQLKGLDLHWMCIPRELGGMNCPLVSYFINAEMMARADVSVGTHYGFHGGMALSMLIFSMREGTTKIENGRVLETRFQAEIEEIGRGDAWGSMDITEPDAGSDMARLRAYGEQDEDGNWFVTGQKIFITSGHGKYHFVIARTETAEDPDDPFAGLGGLSFFLVPAWYEDEDGNRVRTVTIDRAEEKLGHHASPTVALTYDRSPAKLIGKRGEGFRYMLTLMNNARLGVAFESLGVMEASYRKAKAYASERPSMGKTVDKHEMIADYLDMMRSDIEGIRALSMYGALKEELGQKAELFADHSSDPDGERKRGKRLRAEARRITPLLKYIASEKSVEHSRLCVQIHGGNGYTVEYGAEKLLRDAMVFPIYEGTSQIQALMAMKDTLGAIMKSPQRFVRDLAQTRWRSLSARNPLERRVAKLKWLSLETQQFLIRRTAANKMRSLGELPMAKWSQAFFKDWDPKRDFAFAMLHAERLTQLLTDVTICEVLFEQVEKFPHRKPVLERYLRRAEPRCRHMHDLIHTTGAEILAGLEESAQAEAAQ
ncbi:MAG: acyl-CoA dehydrogenase family protein [Nannocystales bacterium]